MARIRQEINPKCGKRLKQLCEELGITQKRLAEGSGVSQNTISKIVKGNGPLTRQIAEEIIKACPPYRIEWLLGYDDAPCETIALNIPNIENAGRCLAAVDLLNSLGLLVGQVNEAGLFIPASEVRGFLLPGRAVEIRRKDTVIWRGNIEKMDNVLLEICDFALFKIEQLKKSGDELSD